MRLDKPAQVAIGRLAVSGVYSKAKRFGYRGIQLLLFFSALFPFSIFLSSFCRYFVFVFVFPFRLHFVLTLLVTPPSCYPVILYSVSCILSQIMSKYVKLKSIPIMFHIAPEICSHVVTDGEWLWQMVSVRVPTSSSNQRFLHDNPWTSPRDRFSSLFASHTSFANKSAVNA